MNILLVHNYYRFWGGEDEYIQSLTNLLKSEKHNVFTYTRNSGDIKSILDKFKVAVGMFWNPKAYEDLEILIKKERIDIAQIQNIFPLISPAIYGVFRKYKIPVIQRISNYRLIYPELYNSRIATLVFKMSLAYHRYIGSYDHINAYIFPSTLIREEYMRELKIPKRKAFVIPTIISKYLSNIFSEKGRRYFIYVGRLSREKGIDQLVVLFSKLPSIILVIVGDGPLEEVLVKKYKNNKNIIFKGFIQKKRLARYYKYAIATIVPSFTRDVFPTVLLESFSTKTPIIAPKRDIFAHVIKQKVTGLLYNPTDYQDLKEKIIYAQNNKMIIRKMGLHAYEEFMKYYSHEAIVQKLCSLYCRLIKK